MTDSTLLTLDAAESAARGVLEEAELASMRAWRDTSASVDGAVASYRQLALAADRASDDYRVAMRRRLLAEMR